VALTAAGEVLREDGRALLHAAEGLRRRVTATLGGRALTVGLFVGDSGAGPLRACAQRRPDVETRLHRLYWHDQVAALHDGTVDVAFVHLPIDDTGLQLLAVGAEPRVVVVAATHPLAERASVSIADLGDDPVLVQAGAGEAWEAFHNVDPRPDGRRPRRGPAVSNVEEKLEQVAAGAGISFVPASTAASVAHPGVRFVPVDDIPPIRVCLAWPSDRRLPVIDDFVAAVQDVAPRPAGR
jgi:DNA-binding transcriptional LysR family regulator